MVHPVINKKDKDVLKILLSSSFFHMFLCYMEKKKLGYIMRPHEEWQRQRSMEQVFFIFFLQHATYHLFEQCNIFKFVLFFPRCSVLPWRVYSCSRRM